MRSRITAFFLVLVLGACTTEVETNPQRSATEQLLISTAADRAAEKLAPQIPKNATVFVDAGNFEGTDSKYAIAAIRAGLLKAGAHLVDDKKAAKTIVEIRSGALSTDQKSYLVGIPSFNVPVPLAGGGLTFPEIALYKSSDQQGIAKFAAVGYDAKTGKLPATQVQEPQFGFSHNTKTTILIFFSWAENDILPQTDKDIVARSVDGAIHDVNGGN